jgi:branched-chain amino acid transport system ATP-binding protein
VALLETIAVNVRFGGHHAVRDVDLSVEAGRITGLIGPNGAGKTTTFNAITGMQETAGGKVLFDDKDISGLPTHKRARLGIARTFQRLEVFGSMTARENILTAAEFHKSWARTKDDPRRVADSVIERIGIGAVADSRVDAMPTGQARLVELGRALATGPRVLLLDLAADGMAILMVEHDVALVMKVCEWIHVLDFGAILAVGTPEEIQQNRQVLDAYLGAAAEESHLEHAEMASHPEAAEG